MSIIAKSERKIAVGKTDAVGIDVAGFMGEEPILTLNVTEADGLVSVGANQINGSILSVLLTGVATGGAKVVFDYATATRSGCVMLIVPIVPSC